jgi:hypothetical protein
LSYEVGSSPNLVLLECPNHSPLTRRRFFSAADKLRLLEAAVACPYGELGAFLRCEGLYSSLITNWRRLRAAGQLSGLAPQKRGPKANPQAAELARQQQTISRLQIRLQLSLLLTHSEAGRLFRDLLFQRRLRHHQRSHQRQHDVRAGRISRRDFRS